MNKGITYKPMVEVDACAQLLVLTPATRKSLLADAFLAVLAHVLNNE